MRFGLMLKVIILAGLTLGFGIVLLSIQGVVGGRETYRDKVVGEVAQSTAGRQTLIGPMLVVPYRERVANVVATPNVQPPAVVRGEIDLLPDSLVIESKVVVEERYRGIYRAQVYRSTHRLHGVFRVPANLGPDHREGMELEPGALVVGVGDARGLRKQPVVRLNGATLELRPGTGLAWLAQGFSADPGPLLSPREARIPFEIEIELVGTDQLAFVPVGASTQASMESDWPHPSFSGGFLPDERSVTDAGFRATWQLSRYATGVDDAIRQHGVRGTGGFAGPDFGVRFIRPVDVYQQSERAVKYGMLFVVLTFAAFFLFEVLKRLAIHPIQYGLAGAALALFFLLLVSLSEHVPFLLAYLVASAACVGLLAFYVGHVLGSFGRGAAFGGVLAALYTVLYVLLQSEDYALLLGSLFLFAVLAAVMVMTRRVDWYRVGEAAGPETNRGTP
jgi:inner membrane protein